MVMTPDTGCVDLSRAAALADLRSTATTSAATEYATLERPGGTGTITVPALAGSGTGFSLPNAKDLMVFLGKAGAGEGIAFEIFSSTSSLSAAAATPSVRSACAAFGGTLSIGITAIVCGGSRQYSAADIASVLPQS